MSDSHKTKQYLLVLAKVLVIVLTFGYVFYRLRNIPQIDYQVFANQIFSKGNMRGFYLLFFILLAIINWVFEILKWKNLVSIIEKIDFKTALRQSLASLTVSLATPNRIGEYGAKALFFEKKKRKTVLLLNLYSNAAQLATTVVFGLIGILYFFQNYDVSYFYRGFVVFGIGIISILIFLYVFRERELLIKGFSIAKVFSFFQKLSNSVKVKIFVFSVFRYLIFSLMFYGLLLFFGAEIGFYTAFALIFSMYLLVSIVPSIFIFDVMLRGGVAVWLFSYAGISDLTVLSTVLVMWILNFVIPSIIGSYFVVIYQPVSQ